MNSKEQGVWSKRIFTILNPSLLAPRSLLNNKGMALLMTILIITLLSLLIIDINSRSLLAITRAKNSVNSLKAYYIMRSGVSAAMGFLERDAREGSSVDTLSEDWASGVKDFPVGDGTVTVDIVDEASKFNINTLVSGQGKIQNDNEKSAVARFGRLLNGLGIEEGLSEKAAEWLKMTREEFSYTFRDVSELLLVPDFTPEALKKIEGYITVYPDRAKKININTVAKEVLVSLSTELNETLVEGILEYRKEHPFKVISDLGQVPGLTDSALRMTFDDALDVKSSDFTVVTEAKVSDTVRKGAAVVNRTGSTVKVMVWKGE